MRWEWGFCRFFPRTRHKIIQTNCMSRTVKMHVSLCGLTPSLPPLCVTSNHVEKQYCVQIQVPLYASSSAVSTQRQAGRWQNESVWWNIFIWPKCITTMHTSLSDIIFATSRVPVRSKITSGGKITVTCTSYLTTPPPVKLPATTQCCRSACGVSDVIAAPEPIAAWGFSSSARDLSDTQCAALKYVSELQLAIEVGNSRWFLCAKGHPELLNKSFNETVDKVFLQSVIFHVYAQNVLVCLT